MLLYMAEYASTKSYSFMIFLPLPSISLREGLSFSDLSNSSLRMRTVMANVTYMSKGQNLRMMSWSIRNWLVGRERWLAPKVSLKY